MVKNKDFSKTGGGHVPPPPCPTHLPPMLIIKLRRKLLKFLSRKENGENEEDAAILEKTINSNTLRNLL